MTLQPLLAAPIAVQIHVVAALSALLLGIFLFTRRKGDPTHRSFGRVWVGLMIATVVSSAFMPSIFLERAPAWTLWIYGPIHLLSIMATVSLIVAIWAVRTRRIALHRKTMRSLFFYALIGAGAFTLLPGRIMHQVLLGG